MPLIPVSNEQVTAKVEELVCARETRPINAEELGVDSPVEPESSTNQLASVAHFVANESSTDKPASVDHSAATNASFPPTTSEFSSIPGSADDAEYRMMEDDVAFEETRPPSVSHESQSQSAVSTAASNARLLENAHSKMPVSKRENLKSKAYLMSCDDVP
ncbi:hypothetical protein V6N13_132466 [Hibiscus sabdariffa]|uniref:Uncharacterized protein n=1 Tax=Hibiscus sabdariffa TaxID=183260 RepID=A0ABR2PVF5_9ROSI